MIKSQLLELNEKSECRIRSVIILIRQDKHKNIDSNSNNSNYNKMYIYVKLINKQSNIKGM